MNRAAVLLALLCCTLAAASPSAADRWLPESCRPLLDPANQLKAASPDSAEARWNQHYRQGFAAVEDGDLDTAERSFCQALAAARSFAPEDIRFAETLDELGLVSYLRGDDTQAEAMQGAATTEILLALGPPTPDQLELGSSSFATYLTRLGWVYERQGHPERLAELAREPYRILGLGYVPEQVLASRLDWLISRYLLAEEMGAADWLVGLRERLRAEGSER